MTPLATLLSRFLPPALVELALALIYAIVLFVLFWRMNEGLVHSIPYLDVGRG